MCGRFTLHSPREQILQWFDLPKPDFHYKPSYNITPTQQIICLLMVNDKRTATESRWGLIPAWQRSKDRPLINARLETLVEKKTFSHLVDSGRCLIIANGFYEWKQVNGHKQPYYIFPKRQPFFVFAGLYDERDQISCTIITRASQDPIKHIHHRMPLILSKEEEQLWLSRVPFEQLGFMIENERNCIAFHPVSLMVNSPRNNSIKCIEPL